MTRQEQIEELYAAKEDLQKALDEAEVEIVAFQKAKGGYISNINRLNKQTKDLQQTLRLRNAYIEEVYELYITGRKLVWIGCFIILVSWAFIFIKWVL